MKDTLFAVTHPCEAAKAWRRQIAVLIDHELPPHTSTHEEFPGLSVREAAMRMREARGDFGSGVPRCAWSEEDQKLMVEGRPPRSCPDHPNV